MPATWHNFPAVRLTRREFNDLPEYSWTLPTGTTIGKRWKRNAYDLCKIPINVWCLRFVFPHPPLWILGEYVEPTPDMPPDCVGIEWSRIEIAG
jgi:hypothetical protein